MRIDLPATAYLTACASLPEVGPARLRALARHPDPEALWGLLADPTAKVEVLGTPQDPAVAIRNGVTPAMRRLWADAVATIDVGRLWARHRQLGVAVLVHGDDGFPRRLADDPDPPTLVFRRGDADLDGPCVAIVGTRRASSYGLAVAHRLGRDLADADVCVVSGLASGIDGAAHSGVFAASGGAAPLGVVGTGLDVIYPRCNAALWRAVDRDGMLLSEVPLGTAPARWRFPVRNRLIAALAAVVVVVESGAGGGSMHTVNRADERGRTVLAVPGQVTSPASIGTNNLLADGVQPCRDADDVLCALGLSRPSPAERRVALDAAARRVLDALDSEPLGYDALVERVDLPVAVVLEAVERLCAARLVLETSGSIVRLER